MSNRRNFLKSATALALGSLILPACNSGQKQEQAAGTETGTGVAADSTSTASATGNLGAIGIQLYSVKDVIEQDLPGTLKQLANYGYKEIEAYPGQKGHYFGQEPKEFKKMLNDLGLELVSSHFGSGSKTAKAADWRQGTMLSNFQELVDKAAETGQKYLTCSWLDESLRKDLNAVADLFNKSGEIINKAGMKFAYHNHSFEFEKVGGQVLYDALLQKTDPKLVNYEMDIYWLAETGNDPIAYLNKYKNRFPLVHVKDMDKQDKSKNTEIGTGSIDYKSILRAAKDNGTEHLFVEQESFTRPSLESMKMNYDYLASLSI
ncbi:sugar phosphate isomerase/epimerase family protein [Adhaeribacter aquaticus]|uniref:sugar phosphate isomerase/epimerase family protein n=1 Tax=Adhaeribacter aquaticus TaxID=299567 RepID=UPI00054CE40E|nr:sugar phosphate isomerase/epimerase [Adhaeribacter aquaticus]